MRKWLLICPQFFATFPGIYLIHTVDPLRDRGWAKWIRTQKSMIVFRTAQGLSSSIMMIPNLSIAENNGCKRNKLTRSSCNQGVNPCRFAMHVANMHISVLGCMGHDSNKWPCNVGAGYSQHGRLKVNPVGNFRGERFGYVQFLLPAVIQNSTFCHGTVV